MSTLVTREAPDFSATAVLGDGRLVETFTLSSLRGKYVILFFYPLDFTFVCPSEILAFDDALPDFHAREAQVVGVSVDSPHAHLAWRNRKPEQGGIGFVGFPLVSDLTKYISDRYGVLTDAGVALRGLFLIDREGIVRHALVNDDALGRSVPETLRLLDALILHEKRGVVCPANWQEGEAGMAPSTEGVIDYLSRFAKRRPGR